MKKILISGAGGYVGTMLCEELLSQGYKVIALDRYFFGVDKIKKIKSKNLEILIDDIRFFNESILNGVDVVIDLCGLSNDATSEINPKFTEEINYYGSKRLIELSKKNKVKHYIYSSSASVYGFSEVKFMDENFKLNPLTEYSKSKVSVERVLLDTCDDDFNITILRNSTIYGYSHRMRFDLAVNIMTLTGTKDGIIYIMGDGEQWRPFVHVKDVINVMITCVKKIDDCKNKIFNVGSNNQNLKIKDLANKISSLIPKSKIIFIPNNPDNRSYSLNFNKIENELGYTCKYSIEDGVIEIKNNLENSNINYEDETTHTLNWYKKLIDWDKKISEIKMYDRIL